MDKTYWTKAIREKTNFDVQSSTTRTTCNKDTTGLVTLNTFSRGHLFYVSSGGIIRYYSPLYKSEGKQGSFNICLILLQISN